MVQERVPTREARLRQLSQKVYVKKPDSPSLETYITARNGNMLWGSCCHSLTECPPPVHRLRQPRKAQDLSLSQRNIIFVKMPCSSSPAQFLEPFLFKGDCSNGLKKQLAPLAQEISQAWESDCPGYNSQFCHSLFRRLLGKLLNLAYLTCA